MSVKLIQAALINDDLQLYLVADPQGDWAPNSPLVQYGRHCRKYLVSVAKNAYCPICGDAVYLT